MIVRIGDYSRQLHEQLYQDCIEAGNLAYEMLFMVPPSLVTKSSKIPGDPSRSFKLKRQWEKWGIKTWDGTLTNSRNQFPSDVDQHRLLQYESCRGLEGWTAVCLDIDQLFELKCALWQPPESELALFDDRTRRERFAFQWCVIPFTRAIDTLVLTIENPNSPLVTVLRDVYSENQGFVEWHEDPPKWKAYDSSWQGPKTV